MPITAEQIYTNLGDKNQIGDFIMIKNVFQRNGVAFAKQNNAVFSLRLDNSHHHFGNPFSSDARLLKKDSSLIGTKSTKESVISYIQWIIGENFNEVDSFRRKWIFEVLKSKILLGKKIVYYKELNEPSHATALYWLIYNVDLWA